MPEALLEIRDLITRFSSPRGVAKAVDTVTLSIMQGETLAVVGESGCGKTVLAQSILGLVPDPPGRVTDGEIVYKGRDLLDLDDEALRTIRGKSIAMVFQEPMTALNPVFRIGEQVAEPLRLHLGMNGDEAADKALKLLAMVGLPNPERIARAFPHELSGGMRQRIMIAMALACEPEMLIADEPTTALDVTIQAQVLDLMLDLKERMSGSLLLITHDLGVVAKMADRIAVMYAGKIVELAPKEALFDTPRHPYTTGLLASVPQMGRKGKLAAIPGSVPGIFALPGGCAFHPRCPHCFERCRTEMPPLFELGASQARCWLLEKESKGAAS